MYNTNISSLIINYLNKEQQLITHNTYKKYRAYIMGNQVIKSTSLEDELRKVFSSPDGKNNRLKMAIEQTYKQACRDSVMATIDDKQIQPNTSHNVYQGKKDEKNMSKKERFQKQIQQKERIKMIKVKSEQKPQPKPKPSNVVKVDSNIEPINLPIDTQDKKFPFSLDNKRYSNNYNEFDLSSYLNKQANRQSQLEAYKLCYQQILIFLADFMQYKYDKDFVKEVQEICQNNRKQLVKKCQNNIAARKNSDDKELVMTYSLQDQQQKRIKSEELFNAVMQKFLQNIQRINKKILLQFDKIREQKDKQASINQTNIKQQYEKLLKCKIQQFENYKNTRKQFQQNMHQKNMELICQIKKIKTETQKNKSINKLPPSLKHSFSEGSPSQVQKQKQQFSIVLEEHQETPFSKKQNKYYQIQK